MMESSVRKEEFSCERDGLVIRGHIWGREGRRKPAVILSHGFMANEKMCHNYAKLLYELGYVAFTFDFCGGGIMCRSGGKTEDMTIITEREDLLTVFNYVRAMTFVDPWQISLLGCSQGGFVSAMVAHRLQNDIANLLLFYPALCIPDDARKGRMMFFKFDPLNIPELLGSFPMRLGGDYAKTAIDMDAFKEISGYRGRTLYLHGTEDKIVDISYARRARLLYPNCTYREIIGGGHMFRGEHDKEACEILKEFMAPERGIRARKKEVT